MSVRERRHAPGASASSVGHDARALFGVPADAVAGDVPGRRGRAAHGGRAGRRGDELRLKDARASALRRADAPRAGGGHPAPARERREPRRDGRRGRRDEVLRLAERRQALPHRRRFRLPSQRRWFHRGSATHGRRGKTPRKPSNKLPTPDAHVACRARPRASHRERVDGPKRPGKAVGPGGQLLRVARAWFEKQPRFEKSERVRRAAVHGVPPEPRRARRGGGGRRRDGVAVGERRVARLTVRTVIVSSARRGGFFFQRRRRPRRDRV
mmetsp:Transcript_5051/g.21480  ORF Transcript_5051/g.21480 Transcript_5051/m.21480 type:complete len:269 (-) Transcript_5051:596-1402(-)